MTKDERRKTKDPSYTGFTLLETIVALSIILAAVIGPVTLITRGILNFGFSENKLVALNLAQEGLELMREIRENNIICDQLNGPASWDWFRDPSGGGIINSGDFEVDTTQTVTISCGASSVTTPRMSLFTDSKFYLDPVNGVYSYSGAPNTVFTRKITIDKPPADVAIPANDQRDVISVVSWTERSIDRNITLRERMYNWR